MDLLSEFISEQCVDSCKFSKKCWLQIPIAIILFREKLLC